MQLDHHHASRHGGTRGQATAQRREMVTKMQNTSSTSTELPAGSTDLVMQHIHRQGSMHDDQRLRAMATRVAEIPSEAKPQTFAKI